ncbi:5-methyltetrahydropteroyltriglutamate--homocysteine S-methyltransferase [Limnobacter sp. P1]|uniref:5-methyltetrahydropteroyltriglutamate-- homocysteine S-methyltransferase n=1 Tax=Limnobacter olei TaxID=3031298 RepID=UPI0023AE7D5A|nr:5-methyltetrahydropteroyltriglutamate--homocysteine S-methyltransferase [Limnobacter sp. P1]
MIKTHTLGFPRIGENRELKFALESHWRGETTEEELRGTAHELRLKHWQAQIDSGLDFITVGDFAFYDQMADHIQLLGCEPARFEFKAEQSKLQRYFTMVRGKSTENHSCTHVHETWALEMTKWFDTNYHYMVPEFTSNTVFKAHTASLVEQIEQAKTLNHPIKVSLIGPLTFLYQGKSKQANFDQFDLLEQLLPVYGQILAELKTQGIEWVQMDEPILGLDLPGNYLTAFERSYLQLKSRGVKILLATYFSTTQGHTSPVCKLPVDGLHIDCVRAEEDLPLVLDWLPNYKVLSLGLIDGRNIWKTNLQAALHQIAKTFEAGKNEVWLAPSCSLLHVPYRFSNDTTVNPLVKPWLAGAIEKLEELELLKQAAKTQLQGKTLTGALATLWNEHQATVKQRAQSPLLNNPEVRARLAALAPTADQRASEFAIRQQLQRKRFSLPAYPTTTIGSFPQTKNIRNLRARFKKSEIDETTYWQHISQEIRQAIEFQERIGLDVLVHGEAERNDMVEYFGEQLEGFTFSANGWVQSYGSRCVKPPILFGDVSRPKAMTVDVARFAQSLSEKPVKGMLTGPVTILQWSFVRNDQARATTALQIALAIRDEVAELEAAGIGMIQIDEPAYREGLPLRKARWDEYLNWASKAFRISASPVRNDTQIHTHMCYSEFNDILPAIAAMDADVITIETSRSDMELLRGFGEFHYPNEIGPGVYDIHSPRVPGQDEIVRLIRKAAQVIPPENLWVNPDCGLKTRGWEETEAALAVMVKATQVLRDELKAEKSPEKTAA